MNNLPLIIGGFYRSGTSLLRRVLDSHSHIHCGPEVKFFKDFYGDYINDELCHVRLFSTLRTIGLNDKELLAIFGKAFVLSHELAASKNKKVRWADKTPENVLYLNQWRELLPKGFFFVHVIRSPLDALSSLKEIGFPRAVPADFKDKVKLLKHFLDQGRAYTDYYPENSITIAYEELVTEPVETLTFLLAKIGEKFESSMLYNFNNSERQSGIEDPKIKATSSVHNKSVGRWQTDLSNEETQYVKKIFDKEKFI